MRVVKFKNKMGRGSYICSSAPGKWDPSLRFSPAFTPKEMLALGVFEGLYLNSCAEEYPKSWFQAAKLSPVPDPSINALGVKSRLPLIEWRTRGWVAVDPRGWFEWYCRFYQGRRLTEEDDRQIKRWRAFVRHSAQVLKNGNRDLTKRRVQRQALLQWSYDPFPDFVSLPGESVYQKTRHLLKA